MSNGNNTYSENSIYAFNDEDQVRKRPAVIFGTNDVNGCAHSVLEILDNAIDEAREGHGRVIVLEVEDDNTVMISDEGRGVPMGWNDREKDYNWKLVFCRLYASGKFDNSNYKSSLGLNGLGATSAQYASEFMDVTSIREGKKYEMHFKKGKPVGDLVVTEDKTGLSGTTVRFKPDREVFTGIDVDINYYYNIFRRQAMLNPGIQFVLRYKQHDEITMLYENGAKDFIDENCPEQIIEEAISFEGEATGLDDSAYGEEYTVEMGLSLTFSREISVIEMYHNSGYLKDASENVTDIALRAGITRAFEEFGKEIGKLTKTDKLNFKDIEEICVAIGYTESPGNMTFFKNQTKTAIGNPFIQGAYTRFVATNLSRWLIDNKVKGEKVLTEILLNKQARESADAVKKKIIQKLRKPIDSLGGLPEKFVECESKSSSVRELFIVEGDSAAGSCKQARNARFQAIMPVRGKIMNCLKEDLPRILKSEIITDLVRLFGCGIEVESKHIKDLPKFDINKLNWNKIILCTDADSDGMQIRCLLITMIYRLMPSLLKEGKVYIAETPLFEIIAKKETYFAYDEKEKEVIMKKLYEQGLSDKQIKVNRSKGLGENDPEMMSVSTMHPNTRRLVRVNYIKDDTELHALINALLGDDIQARKYMIDEYFDMEVDLD